MDDSKCLIVVGRAEDAGQFFNAVHDNIPDQYMITGIHSLDERYEADKSDRFIVFISTEIEGEEFEERSNKLIEGFRALGFGATAFESMEEAFTYAEKEYGFGEEEVEQQKIYSEMRKRFPPFTAEEWEQIQIFDSLYHTNKVRPLRGKFQGQNVIILAHITKGSDMTRITPMMLLINDEIHDEIEIPTSD
jgi:hypothetical protein